MHGFTPCQCTHLLSETSSDNWPLATKPRHNHFLWHPYWSELASHLRTPTPWSFNGFNPSKMLTWILGYWLFYLAWNELDFQISSLGPMMYDKGRICQIHKHQRCVMWKMDKKYRPCCMTSCQHIEEHHIIQQWELNSLHSLRLWAYINPKLWSNIQ